MIDRPNINVCYIGATEYFFNHQTMLVLRLSKWLKSHHRIELTKLDRADIIWVATGEFYPDLLNTGKPIILEDRHQSPEIFGEVREILQHPNVYYILKQSKPSDIAWYNKPLANHSMHQDIIAEAIGLTDEKQTFYPDITPELANKIRISWNYIGWGDFVPQTRYEIHNHPKVNPTYTNEVGGIREVDVNFVGNVDLFDPPAPILQTHRRAACAALEKLGQHNIVLQHADHHTDNRMDWDEYYNLMRRSKITLSPWGWEPITIRDTEAILAGSLVIKPDTSFLSTWPDIPYIPCKPDFSDLREVIDKVLSNWQEYGKMRTKAKYDTIAAINNIGKRIVELIQECYYLTSHLSPLP